MLAERTAEKGNLLAGRFPFSLYAHRVGGINERQTIEKHIKSLLSYSFTKEYGDAMTFPSPVSSTTKSPRALRLWGIFAFAWSFQSGFFIQQDPDDARPGPVVWNQGSSARTLPAGSAWLRRHA